ncbi:hypothetical protein QBC40DRAFT_259739 [Triangularia verruculosa]|uniref:CCHC-type domain-containing protein n=1 Tax=Triangularia verruculosa TaxID=2587418 RepID=A0AAN7AMX7_9PEZI|nr:hypothetical protein QBC40DRAFT_259739 [Triangularia verruculosa]
MVVVRLNASGRSALTPGLFCARTVMRRNCKEDKREPKRIQIKCYNCDEVRHRVRDCPTPRVDKSLCKNCGQLGHPVSECTEPRSVEGVEWFASAPSLTPSSVSTN